MSNKHGELKIMTVSEMVDMFCENDYEVGMDFAVLDFDKKSLHGVPAKYLDIEKIYTEAWGWNGIRILPNPFDVDDIIIVAVGHYGSTLRSVFSIDMEYGYEDDESDVYRKLLDAVCECDDETIKDDALLIVEMHDEAFKQAEEEEKCRAIINEKKEKMAI